jgi:hypothetical protein
MIPIDKYLAIIKKQGATGVLALWLWYTHTEVQDLKYKLYECYGKARTALVNSEIDSSSFYAIVPKDELTEAIKDV